MAAVTNKRNDFGVKEGSDCYREGGERVLWLDGMIDSITLRVVAEIRAAGFKCWRTGDKVWVRAGDTREISGLNIVTDR